MDNEKTEELLVDKTPKKPEKKNNKTLFIIIGIIALIAIIAIGVYFYFQYREKEFQKNLELGIGYLQDGDYEQATLSFNKAIDIDNKSIEAYEYLAQSATLEKDYPLAHTAYDELIELSDNPIPPTVAKAELYVAEGKETEAEELLKTLQEEYPDNEDLDYYLNLYSNAILINNEMNYSVFTYDTLGNVYFISGSNYNTDSKFRILKYNLEDPKPEVIVTENTINNSTQIAVWNNRIYINLDDSVYSYNTFGSDKQLEAENYTFKYLDKGKLYESINAYKAGSIREYDIEEKQFTDYDVDPKRQLGSWIVYNGNIYYADTAEESSGGVEIMEYNLSNGTLTSLNNYLGGEQTFLHGLYCYGEDLFLHYSYYTSTSYETVFFKYDLANKKSEELKFSGKDNSLLQGFNVDDQYYYVGTDTYDINIFNKNDLSLEHYINVEDVEGYPIDDWEIGGSMISKGVTILPKYMILNARFIEMPGYQEYLDIYQINIDTWDSSELYSNK